MPTYVGFRVFVEAFLCREIHSVRVGEFSLFRFLNITLALRKYESR